jgi:cardiolipin synthase A/B
MRARVVIGMVAAAILVVGVSAYAGGRYAARNEPPVEGHSPGQASYEWTTGNDAELLIGYEAFVSRVLGDLRDAQELINIVEYNWEPTGPSIEIAEILKQQVRAGVEVNVSTDKRGSFGIDSNSDPEDVQAYFDDLEAAGVNVIVTDPGGNLNPIGLFLDHRKLFDIDRRVSYVGGMGLASSPGGKYDDWHDLMLRVEGPASAQVGMEFLHHWKREGGEVSQRQLAAFANAAAVDDARASVQLLANTPGEELAATEHFMQMARTSDDRLWVMTPYIGTRSVQHAMIEAAERGIDVRVLLPGRESGSNTPQLVISRAFYRELVDAGVRVYIYPGMMHAKAWLGDDEFNVGSTNLSKGALYEYLELSAAIKDDPELLETVEQMLEGDFAKSEELTADDFGLGDRAFEIFRDVTNLDF